MAAVVEHREGDRHLVCLISELVLHSFEQGGYLFPNPRDLQVPSCSCQFMRKLLAAWGAVIISTDSWHKAGGVTDTEGCVSWRSRSFRSTSENCDLSEVYMRYPYFLPKVAWKLIIGNVTTVCWINKQSGGSCSYDTCLSPAALLEMNWGEWFFLDHSWNINTIFFCALREVCQVVCCVWNNCWLLLLSGDASGSFPLCKLFLNVCDNVVEQAAVCVSFVCFSLNLLLSPWLELALPQSQGLWWCHWENVSVSHVCS